MKQARRNLFESCRELTEQHWRDWDHKTRYEWKLSFGYWAALLAMTAIVLKERIEIPVWLLALICTAALFLHINFLRWIQHKLMENRTEIFRIQKKMRDLVGVKLGREPDSVKTSDKWWLQVSLWTQAGITSLLILLLVYSVFATKITPADRPNGPAGAANRPVDQSTATVSNIASQHEPSGK